MRWNDRLKEKWSSLHAENKAISRGMATVAGYVIIARLIGAIKEIILAWRLGVGPQIDAFSFVSNFVLLPVSIWFSVISVVLIPVLVKSRNSSDLNVFRREFYGFSIAVSILTFFLTNFMHSDAFLLKFGGLPLETALIAKPMILPLTLLGPLGIFIAIFSIETMAQERHTNTLLEGFPPLIVGLTLIFIPDASIWSLVFGIVAGSFLQFLFLGWELKKFYHLPMPMFSFSANGWKPFINAIGIILLGQLIQSCTGVVDQIYAARLDAGTLSELGYANRIIALAFSLGATVVSRAALPVLSAPTTDKSPDRRQRMVNKWALLLLLSGIVMTASMWPLASLFVKYLFERGAFLAHNTFNVAKLVQYGSLQLPFYFSSLVFVSQIAAERQYKFLTQIALVSLIVKLFGNTLLIPKLGACGLMLSTSIMYLTSNLLLAAVSLFVLSSRFSKSMHYNDR